MHFLAPFIFRLSIGLIVVFTVLPILIVVVASLSPTDRIDLFPASISFRWYAAIFSPEWLVPMQRSLLIAAIVSIGATLLGLLGAMATHYYRCPGHSFFTIVFLSPLSAPQVVKSIALLQLFSALAIQARVGLWGLLIGHVVMLMPFAVRMIMNSLGVYDRNVENAALILGANRFQVLRLITIPLLMPGIFAALAFTFILSFNNVEMSLFLSGPGMRTYPIQVMNYFQYSIDPVLAAANVATLILVLFVVVLADRVGGSGRVVLQGTYK